MSVMSRRPMILLAALVAVACGCKPDVRGNAVGSNSKKLEFARQAASNQKYHFTDVTETAGINFTYQNGRESKHNAILESLGGGAGLVDFDLDGMLDVFFPGGGRFQALNILGLPGKLYRNLGGWRYAEVSKAAGQGFDSPHYTHGCFAADMDNDGFDDMLITGYGGVQLWKNLGDGTFEEVHEQAGLLDDSWSAAAAWGDFDNDGFLDVYVAHYVNWSFANHQRCSGVDPRDRDICPPKVFDALPDTMYRNQGDGTFADISESAGLRKDGKGLGVITADIEPDGDIDIYVANDTTENFLYRNDGNGVFQEVAGISSVAVDDRGTPNGSMGVDISDFNLDGRPDIWVANFEVEAFALYRNDGNGQFMHVSRATGVTALGGLFVGFGTAFLDVELDGDEDLLVSNGHVINFPRSAPLLQQALLLVNDEAKRYHRYQFDGKSYFSKPHAGRGLATGDLDADGDYDLVFANNLEPAAVLRNDVPRAGQWLQVELIGRESNRNAVGAVLTLKTKRGEQMRMVKSGVSYLSTCDRRQIWGIPEGDSPETLRVRWPSGKSQELDVSQAAGSLTRLYEPVK